MRGSRRIVSVVAFLVMAQAVLGATGPGSRVSDYASARAARARGLTTPYGWMSLIALDWLKAGVSTVGSAADNSIVLAGAPAHWVTLEQKDGKVRVIAAGASVAFQGRVLGAGDLPLVVGSGEEDESALSSVTLKFWVIDRSGRRYLRVKDSQALALKQFHGLRWYAPNARYRVEARWVPDATPHVVQVPNKIGQVTSITVPGHVEFELNGTKQTMFPIEAEKDGLWFVFRDETYRHTTDGGGRFLTTDAPSNGLDKPGTVVLDFNRAVNPPCAYSPYATCPLAPKEDRLPIAVLAGEKRYDE